MNEKLSKKISDSLRKSYKLSSEIFIKDVNDSQAYFGPLAYINLIFNQEEVDDFKKEDVNNFYKLYLVKEQIIYSLFNKHLNFITYKEYQNNFIGFFKVTSESDFNTLFELSTMLNSYRKEWNQILSNFKLKSLNFNIHMGIKENVFVSDFSKPKFFSKNDDKLTKKYLLDSQTNWIESFHSEKDEIIIIDEAIVNNLKIDYKKMCSLFNEEEQKYQTTACATFSEKFNW